MMKQFMGVLVLIAVVLTAQIVLAQQQDSIFERNFRQLHKEPPPPPAKSRATVETLWIDQPLDHFDANNKVTWKMRYMANSEFYQSGGPLFIFVGGEWAISTGYITGGHMYDMAKEHNGYLFYTEHRYYGQSRPTSDITTENLQYLHVRQALADLAHFITTMKDTLPGMTNSKVILTGGSYSASMVTWFKKLYPDLAIGCWSSSAPLFAKVDFVEYKEVTGASIRQVGGEACYKRIESAVAEVEGLFAAKRGAEVKAMFKLCNNFDDTNDLDLWTFFSSISDAFAGVVQYHSTGDIESVCNTILQGDDDVAGLAKYVLRAFGNAQCNDLSYESSVLGLKGTFYTSSIMRQWMFQTCNEYGWYQTSGSRNQPFGKSFPVTLYTTMCHDAYGKQYSNEFIHKQAADTNTLFGGLKPDVENVYTTHGSLDPWNAMGIRNEDEATVLQGYAHCADFASISTRDTPEMRASKERIAELVREWVGTPSAKDIDIVDKAEKLLQKLRN